MVSLGHGSAAKCFPIGRRFPPLVAHRLELDSEEDLVEARRQLADDGFVIFRGAASAGEMLEAENVPKVIIESAPRSPPGQIPQEMHLLKTV